jgi:hypothetical protein
MRPRKILRLTNSIRSNLAIISLESSGSPFALATALVSDPDTASTRFDMGA